MRQILIQKIEDSINSSTRPFLREQDIQIKIINDLKNSNISIDNIFFEYNIKTELVQNHNYPWMNDENIYVDIVIESQGKFYPVEIKYKTIRQFFIQNIFGENGLQIATENQGASNLACYGLWKDVKRLEILKDRFEHVEKGIVLFVTNDKSYKRLPLNQHAGYANFSIYDNRFLNAGTHLSWNGNLAIANTRPPFTINNDYTINWNELNTEYWNKVDNSVKHFYFII